MLLPRRALLVGIASGLVSAGCRSGASSEGEPMGPFVPPAELAARMADVQAGRIVVLYAGPDVLFSRGHVPGARQLGPVDSEQGRRRLAEAIAKIPNETEIVVYCGCCPFKSCPNVRPASATLRAAARKNARFLDLPTRFATDWTDKGFPVERS